MNSFELMYPYDTLNVPHIAVKKDNNNKYLTFNTNFDIRRSVQMTWTRHTKSTHLRIHIRPKKIFKQPYVLKRGIVIVLAGHHPSTEADGENVRDRVIISKSVPKVGTKLAKIDVLACFFCQIYLYKVWRCYCTRSYIQPDAHKQFWFQ